MFKLSTLLSLSAALAMTRTSIAQDDMPDVEGLLKVVECLSTDGESLLSDDCTCNDLKGLADMNSDIGSQLEDSGLDLQSFKDCCEDGTTNEEYTQCIYNPDLGVSDEGDGSSEDGVDADLPDETIEVEEPVDEEPDDEEEAPPPAATENSSGMNVNFGSSLVLLGVGTALTSLF